MSATFSESSPAVNFLLTVWSHALQDGPKGPTFISSTALRPVDSASTSEPPNGIQDTTMPHQNTMTAPISQWGQIRIDQGIRLYAVEADTDDPGPLLLTIPFLR
jgi:hypothetical protein